MIVMDVNAAVAIARNEAEGKALRSLVDCDERIIAPRLFIYEMGNTVWKIVRAGWLSEGDGFSLFQNALELVDGFADTTPLIIEATHEAVRNNHPVYDMLYFVLARRNRATLFTLDKKLRAICEANGVNCLGVERI